MHGRVIQQQLMQLLMQLQPASARSRRRMVCWVRLARAFDACMAPVCRYAVVELAHRSTQERLRAKQAAYNRVKHSACMPVLQSVIGSLLPPQLLLHAPGPAVHTCKQEQHMQEQVRVKQADRDQLEHRHACQVEQGQRICNVQQASSASTVGRSACCVSMLVRTSESPVWRHSMHW